MDAGGTISVKVLSQGRGRRGGKRLWSGAIVSTGECEAIVTHTGPNTRMCQTGVQASAAREITKLDIFGARWWLVVAVGGILTVLALGSVVRGIFSCVVICYRDRWYLPMDPVEREVKTTDTHAVE
eukprot:4367755-Prymnesium_polylepis.2